MAEINYISIVINATATGMGVALGNEVYSWFKEKRKKAQEKIIKPIFNKNIFEHE